MGEGRGTRQASPPPFKKKNAARTKQYSQSCKVAVYSLKENLNASRPSELPLPPNLETIKINYDGGGASYFTPTPTQKNNKISNKIKILKKEEDNSRLGEARRDSPTVAPCF